MQENTQISHWGDMGLRQQDKHTPPRSRFGVHGEGSPGGITLCLFVNFAAIDNRCKPDIEAAGGYGSSETG